MRIAKKKNSTFFKTPPQNPWRRSSGTQVLIPEDISPNGQLSTVKIIYMLSKCYITDLYVHIGHIGTELLVESLSNSFIPRGLWPDNIYWVNSTSLRDDISSAMSRSRIGFVAQSADSQPNLPQVHTRQGNEVRNESKTFSSLAASGISAEIKHNRGKNLYVQI